jgi:hypothetical protein
VGRERFEPILPMETSPVGTPYSLFIYGAGGGIRTREYTMGLDDFIFSSDSLWNSHTCVLRVEFYRTQSVAVCLN